MTSSGAGLRCQMSKYSGSLFSQNHLKDVCTAHSPLSVTCCQYLRAHRIPEKKIFNETKRCEVQITLFFNHFSAIRNEFVNKHLIYI